MNETSVIEIGTNAVIVAMKVASPALFSILIAGIIISIIQAATQINEQTLSFIPKIIAMSIALIVTGPWILQTMIYFTSEIITSLPEVTR